MEAEQLEALIFAQWQKCVKNCITFNTNIVLDLFVNKLGTVVFDYKKVSAPWGSRCGN